MVFNLGLFVFFIDVQIIDNFGWVVGFGIELVFVGLNWIGCFEYLYYGFSLVEIVNVFLMMFFGVMYFDKWGG